MKTLALLLLLVPVTIKKIKNELWPEIKKQSTSVWIWGGDTVYSDTEDMQFKTIIPIQKQDQISKSKG
jgi:hypothetical protein